MRPAAAGGVQRHRQNYGRRGALQAFLVQSLQDAADVGLSSRELTSLASVQFGLDFVSKAEFNNYLRNSVQPRLRELREKGQVENLASPGRDGMLWRWKRTAPTFADLARLVQGSATVGSDSTLGEAGSAVMALTMTRTRTQKTLTRPTKLLANLNGELEFVECLMRQLPEQQSVLAIRRIALLSNRDAAYATILQFDPEIEAARIGCANEWMRAYGRRGTSLGPEYVRALLETA